MARAARPLTFKRLMSVPRIEQPAVSPDGRHAAYVVVKVDLPENRIRRSIHLVDLATGKDRELTPGAGNHQHPAWSPSGAELAFVSDRDEKQGTQLWVLPIAGGEARRLTTGYGGASHPLWAPDGRRILFTRRVVVSPHLKGRGAKREAPADSLSGPTAAEVYGLSHPKSSAQIADSLMFRHWDEWRDGRRNHLFMLDTRTGAMNDLTRFDVDAPPIALEGERDYDLSPDGRWLAYVANPDREVALSTNNSVFLQRLSGGRAVGAPLDVTRSRACEGHPRFSPDGASLWFLAMQRPGYEADRHRFRVYDLARRRVRTLLERFDRNPAQFAFGGLPAAATIYFLAQDRGRRAVFRLDPRGARVRQLTRGWYHAALAAIPGSDALLVSRESANQPADLLVMTPGAGFAPRLARGPQAADDARGRPAPMPEESAARPLTRAGAALRGLDMHAALDFWYRGDRNHPVHGFLVRPPGFRANRRYPLILLIHGGPQSAWTDNLSYRWSAQLFASRGAVVAMLNPRGSTGYGQRFTDAIRDDWGGACYRDIMLGLDAVLRRFKFIDRRRVAAAGGSFGGYMVNWIAGHTDRFRALVCHDGIFNEETMGYTTEELWFPFWEHHGAPHQRAASYLRMSPHRFAAKFRTPTLVIHGGKDYRCPVSEGIGMFTALQLAGVPSRLVHLPDEGHWVLQPANSQVWYDEVLGWLMTHLERRG